MNYVFLNEKFLHQYDPSEPYKPTLVLMSERCPQGSYIFSAHQGCWYHMTPTLVGRGYSSQVLDDNVPNWAKALLLLIT